MIKFLFPRWPTPKECAELTAGQCFQWGVLSLLQMTGIALTGFIVIFNLPT